MKTEKQTVKKEKSVKEEENIVEFSALEQEKIEQLNTKERDYHTLCSQIGSKETELALLKDEVKNMFIGIVNTKHALEKELNEKYGELRQRPDGRLERVPINK